MVLLQAVGHIWLKWLHCCASMSGLIFILNLELLLMSTSDLPEYSTKKNWECGRNETKLLKVQDSLFHEHF